MLLPNSINFCQMKWSEAVYDLLYFELTWTMQSPLPQFCHFISKLPVLWLAVW